MHSNKIIRPIYGAITILVQNKDLEHHYDMLISCYVVHVYINTSIV